MNSHRGACYSWDEQDLYMEWCTINATEIAESNRKSVLYKLRSTINGQGVVNSVVKSLSSLTGGSVKGNGDGISGPEVPLDCLQSDRDVQWIMEVICYGLSLPIMTTEQHEGVRDCVNIYCEWMCVMSPLKAKEKLIPFPIRDDPNRYFRLIMHHLYNVFIRRSNVSTRTLATNNHDLNVGDITSRQAVLCHRILRTLELVCFDEANLIDSESWDTVLTFLLAINENLLSVPIDREDIGTSLCERIVKSLFEIWTVACLKCFPSPSYWKTFHQLCIKIRHRSAVIDHWSSTCLALTQRLVQFSDCGSVPSPSIDGQLLILVQEMSQETVSQSWFRFLHIIGNPIDICNVLTGQKLFESSTFYNDPSNHSSQLADNFKRAMKGLAALTNVLIGAPVQSCKNSTETLAPAPSPVTPRRPSGAQRPAKSILTAIAGVRVNPLPQIPTLPAQTTTITHLSQMTPAGSFDTAFNVCRLSNSRPKINSILNSLGNWLFAAALMGSDGLEGHQVDDQIDGSSRASSRRGSVSSNQIDQQDSVIQNDLEAGQAEAIGALCRIFSSKRTSEEVSPVFLARFYLSLQYSLSLRAPLKIQVLTNVLVNSTSLFQMDLNGVNILIPHFLRVMEWVVNEHKSSGINSNELRRATVSILLSLSCYPLHFGELQIKDCLTDNSSLVTFRSLRPRFINLSINALRTENDSTNAQLLIVVLLTSVQDFFTRESKGGIRCDLSPSSFASSDTPRGLYVRTLQLVCYNLTSTWRNDTQFSIVALEVLTCLARIKVVAGDVPSQTVMMNEMKKTCGMICDFIVNQCSRPPPFHSKDMHSTMVAAYQCLSVWLQEFPDLLQENDCINTVLQVVELGISGSKSTSGSDGVHKSAKELKPASMRVREAAESLLASLMNNFRTCSFGTNLDEVSLLKRMNKYNGTGNSNQIESCYKRYRFFSHDSCTILSILKETNNDDTIFIVRSAFGKFSWSITSQLLPRRMVNLNPPDIVPRPPPVEHFVSRNKTHIKHFPESIEKIPLTKLDLVVPSLESVVASTPKQKSDHEKLRMSFESQVAAERQAADRIPKSKIIECKDQTAVTSLDPVRLILSHFGYITFSPIENWDRSLSEISVLDFNHSELHANLKAIDSIPTRTSDTVYVYYVRRGRYDPQEILNSVSSKHYVTVDFMDFLTSLGEVINVKQHSGWTGNVQSALRMNDDFGTVGSDHGGSAYDGLEKALYWADISHEMVFVVPSVRTLREDEFSSIDNEKKNKSNAERISTDGFSVSSGEGTSISSRTYSESSRNSIHKSRQLLLNTNAGCEVLVIWLESIDDMTEVPIDVLISMNHHGAQGIANNREFFVIYIHPLANGLFRVNQFPKSSRSPSALPLVDGIVVSDQILASFVRMTCNNFLRKRRLDAESHQAPHVRRRLKIQDVSNRFKLQLDRNEIYHSLFL